MVLGLTRSLSLLSVLSVFFVHATQVMHRPDNYKNPPNVFPMEANPKVTSLYKRATGKVQFAYFVNWGIYTGYNFREPSSKAHFTCL